MPHCWKSHGAALIGLDNFKWHFERKIVIVFYICMCIFIWRPSNLVNTVFGYKLPGCLQSKVLPPGLEADAMPLILLSENWKNTWCNWFRSLLYWSETSFHGAFTWHQKQQVKMSGILIFATGRRMNFTCLLTLKAPRKKCIWKCCLPKSSAANNCLTLLTN